MTWFTVTDDDKPILEEIVKQTDRGAGLIATAYVEQRLLAAIKARLNSNKKIEDNIFGNSGALGTLSAKIDLGLLIGIYDIDTHKVFDTIRKIRNEFAHTARPIDFNSHPIKSWCDNISLVADIKMHDKTTGLKVELLLQPDGTAKTAFLNAIKYLLALLDMETKKLPLRKPSPPIFPKPSPKAQLGR